MQSKHQKILCDRYTSGSFVPLMRIEQDVKKEEGEKSERERMMQEALKPVEEMLIAHGMELKKPQAKPETLRVSFFVTDHAGTPNRLIDEEGQIVWEAEPDDWAAVRNEKGVRQPIRFQGQWVDEETGFYYNRHRYYDPQQGRYITQDPIGLAGEMNLYAYVNGNPMEATDPLGLFEVHGNWCGPDWTGGHQHSYRPAPDGYYKPPTDYTDAACERHDKCFATCRDLNPCNKDARSTCMTACNVDLASAQRLGSSSGTSIARSVAIWLGMQRRPDPESNSQSCPRAR